MARQLKRRIVLRITTQRKLEGLALRHELTAATAVNRAVDWLTAQPELIQAAVLGKFDGPVDAQLAELIIRSITRPKMN